MKVADLPSADIRKKLADPGFSLQIGPFAVTLKSSLADVATGVETLYQQSSLVAATTLIDFAVEVNPPNRLRRLLRPQVNFSFDGQQPFKPLPLAQAFPMFEWGLNWCIASNAHQYLNLHSAVVARNDLALILPGSPGSGKSTLCAALVVNGWRLLSDEMALIRLEDGLITPIPRPISLKNASIDIVRNLSEALYFGPVVADTLKGTVAHMRAPAASIRDSDRNAEPALLVFPKYRAGTETELVPLSKGRALLRIAENSFNYNVLDAVGFELLADTIDRCRCYDLRYSSLDEVIPLLDELIDADASSAPARIRKD